MTEILLIFIAGMVAGAFLSSLRTRKAEPLPFPMPEPEPDNSYRPPKPPAGVVAQQKEKKGANMRAILGAFAWAAEGKLTPDDVEKMLGVSESTALRYLDELEKEGKILKEVSPDRRIYYTKLPEELS